MTEIKFIMQGDKYIGVLCEGHTGFAESGKDIVCASISSIIGSLQIGVTKVLKINADVKTNEDRGYLELRLPKKICESKLNECQVLFKTALAALQDLQSGYAHNINVEVKSL